MPKPKTTIRVSNRRWEFFNKECQASFLRRDAYLSHVLPGELDILEEIPACDEEGRQWLKESVRLEVNTSSVAITLDEPVLKRLNSVCAEKLIPRDAFFSRFLEFITARLFEPAVVIKNPRTNTDIASQLAEVFNDHSENEEENEDELRYEILDIAKGWATKREGAPNLNLRQLRRDHYREFLSYDKNKVESLRRMLTELENI